MKKLKGSKIIKKQSTLFPEKEVTLIPEIDLKETQRLAAQIKAPLLLDSIETMALLTKSLTTSQASIKQQY